jgi:hypothetical protein
MTMNFRKANLVLGLVVAALIGCSSDDKQVQAGTGGTSTGTGGGIGGSAGTGGSAGSAGTGVICSETSSSLSIGGSRGCEVSFASCSDGNGYSIQCGDTQCTCAKNGNTTSTYSPAPGSSCDPQLAKCGWDLRNGCRVNGATWVPPGQPCEAGLSCCNAQGFIKCARNCGDGGTGGGGA